MQADQVALYSNRTLELYPRCRHSTKYMEVVKMPVVHNQFVLRCSKCPGHTAFSLTKGGRAERDLSSTMRIDPDSLAALNRPQCKTCRCRECKKKL